MDFFWVCFGYFYTLCPNWWRKGRLKRAWTGFIWRSSEISDVLIGRMSAWFREQVQWGIWEIYKNIWVIMLAETVWIGSACRKIAWKRAKWVSPEGGVFRQNEWSGFFQAFQTTFSVLWSRNLANCLNAICILNLNENAAITAILAWAGIHA